MPAGDPVFVDTNVLVYVSRPAAPQHRRALDVLTCLEHENVEPWVSLQVLREYLAVVTRPQVHGPALPMSDALADVMRLRTAFRVTTDLPDGFDRLLRLLEAHPGGGKQVHDANLVAAMLGQGIRRLLSFNAADFRRFEPLIELIAP
jgi:predicted nucleic acid-binding protein